ncbi:hypothetical protein Pelo_6530 [Pelomyxa schiedti]|nr:hypothetical protein Pelo_6530 [Pelomyxa schiedti]
MNISASSSSRQPLTIYQIDYIIGLSTAPINIFTVGILVYTYFSVVSRGFTTRIPLYLATGGIVRALSLMSWFSALIRRLFSGIDTLTDPLCWTVEITQFWSIMTCSWWFVGMSLFLVLTVYPRWILGQNIFFTEGSFFVACSVVPFPLAVVIAVIKYYAFERDGNIWSWCERFSRFEMVALSLPVPLGIGLLLAACIKIFTIKNYRLSNQPDNKKQLLKAQMKLFRQLAAFPIAYAMLLTIQLIWGYNQAFNSTTTTASPYLFGVDIVLITLAPLVISILYAMTYRHRVKDTTMAIMQKIGGCLKKRHTNETELSTSVKSYEISTETQE